MTLDDIDWTTWIADAVASIVFVRRGGEVLLIRKKRGLGAGKIDAPGGKLEAGETPEVCAAREVLEEVGVRVGALRYAGEHRHQFVDGLKLHIHVYVTDEAIGTPIETEEAVPHWFPEDQLPVEEMWQDNRMWIPTVLNGGSAFGRYVFDGDRMVDHVLELVPE